MNISLIVPLFNEALTIELFYKAVRSEPSLAEHQVEIVFINDGSVDASGAILRRLAEQDEHVVVVTFSRNFGKEPALFAGLDYATGDAMIPMDVDLQDPVDVLPRLIAAWQEGAEVVLAKRFDRSADGLAKRGFAAMFYYLHNRIASTKIEANVGDFRLMDRKVVEAIKTLPEHVLFMKGVLSWVGFNTVIIGYERAARSAGSSKFNAWKLWNLALEGITSFSTVPLRLWSYLGGMVSLGSLVYAGVTVVDKWLYGNKVPGYPSLMTAILFLGGVQLIGIGVLGEYIGRIYMESKQRPRYVVKEILKHRPPQV
ncbi:glycosyltransferase family 2 protein [Pseudomonas sp. dw_358]|uniref:glycosyltransferase family 2 protein n=1 Tax=Pseudomonas sp. dw_358 TaxID=2720083 RepID=UPI001BD6C1E2|nr:glycosyltransferase family 2 protein [Pseudomonas sp. dw_358]